MEATVHVAGTMHGSLLLVGFFAMQVFSKVFFGSGRNRRAELRELFFCMYCFLVVYGVTYMALVVYFGDEWVCVLQWVCMCVGWAMGLTGCVQGICTAWINFHLHE